MKDVEKGRVARRDAVRTLRNYLGVRRDELRLSAMKEPPRSLARKRFDAEARACDRLLHFMWTTAFRDYDPEDATRPISEVK